jgi:ribosomal protein S10
MEEINLQLNSYEEKKLSEIQDEINDWFYKAYWS